jgi:cell division protease FtsH
MIMRSRIFFLIYLFLLTSRCSLTTSYNPFDLLDHINASSRKVLLDWLKELTTLKSASLSALKTNLPVYTFDSIAGHIPDDVIEIVDLINRPEKYKHLGIEHPKGILLYGPPGTGKTSLARAIAGEAHAAFFHTSGTDFVELYAGTGPQRIRELFDRATMAVQTGSYQKAIIFIDEIDAIGGSRQYLRSGVDREYHNSLNELLRQMDGFVQNQSILIIGATNRREDLDQALLRAGRFDRLIEITLPDEPSRKAIIELYADKLSVNVTPALFGTLAKKTAGCSGAELKNLVREAALLAVRGSSLIINDKHFIDALKKILEQKKLR